MLRGVPDTVCKLLASASVTPKGRSLNSFRRYSIFRGQKASSLKSNSCPQLWCLAGQFLSTDSRYGLFRGAKLVPGLRGSSLVLVSRNLVSTTQFREGKLQSFSAAHVAADGRDFRFATVMVPDMKEGDSALQAWNHACTLIGESRCPTLAVAFVSKATKSAIEAVKEISQLLLKSRTGSLEAADEEIPSPDEVHTAERANLHVQSRNEESTGVEILAGKPHGVRIASIHTDLGRRVAKTEGSGSKQDVSPEVGGQANIPLIGCVASGWAEEFGKNWRVVGSVPTVGISGNLGARKVESNKRTLSKFDLGKGCKALVFDLQTTEDLSGDLTGDRERFLAVAAEVVDPEDDEATLSDWEHFSAEVLQPDAFTGVEGATTTSGGIVSVDWTSFANRVDSGGSSGGEATAVNGSLELQTQNQDPCEYAIDHGRLHASREIYDDGTMVSNDDSESNAIQGKGRKYVSPSKARGPSKIEDEQDAADGNYQLTICLGHFPGTDAVSFYSSSTGLPLLPNLEEAVLVNNPHMLLLGAAGFKFPDFIQRLSSVFPNSSRAGAFLAPLFSSIRSQYTKVAEQQAGPIFHGGDVHTKGVVGLAISSAGTGDVPVAAFGEFVRMSLGIPHIRGYTYLDDPISKSLFFPQNVSVEHLAPGQRETSSDAKSVLNYLNQYILRNSGLPVKPTVPETSSAGVAVDLKVKDLDRVPLALFDAVIFPGWSMPIHIYEPRYRIMVKQCMEQDTPFGLSSSLTAVHSDTVDSQEIIGTIVNLKVHLFEKDCRSYIIANGVQRFRVVDKVSYQPASFGLAVGQVRFFDDTIAKSAKERRELGDLAKEAVALCQRIIPEMREVPGLVGSASDPKVASFALGHLLPVPTLVKTRWLGMEDTKARLLEQMTFLEKRAAKK